MTVQDCDRLDLGGQTWLLHSTPLRPLLVHAGVQFRPVRTDRVRGYVATWEIRGDRLWLTAVSGAVERRIPLAGLTGMLQLPSGARSAGIQQCNGLIFSDPAGPALPVIQGFAQGAWFISRKFRTAIRVYDEGAARRFAADRVGALVCGVSKVELSRAHLYPTDRCAEARDLRDLQVQVPDGTEHGWVGWVPLRDETTWGPMGYPGAPVDAAAWISTGAPPAAGFEGFRLNPPPWPVERLVISRLDAQETDLDAIGERPIPAVADWVSGELRVTRPGARAETSGDPADSLIIDVDRGVVTAVRPEGEPYTIRIGTDLGSGYLLWAANDAAGHRWGYQIDHHELPIGHDLAARCDQLLAEFDEVGPEPPPGWWRLLAPRLTRLAIDLGRALGPGFRIEGPRN